MANKITGIVSSSLQDKTIVVTTTRRETHPLYGKQYTVTRKFTAHDEKNQAKPGDRVELEHTRPFSKTKSLKLTRILEASHDSVELKDEETEV